MLEHFLRYSLVHNRPIRVICLEHGAMSARTITVTEIADAFIVYRQGKRNKLQQIPIASLLSASYARGDDGSLSEEEKDI